CFDQISEVVGKHRTGKLTARRSVYNPFSPHKQKCRSALTERHYRQAGVFYLRHQAGKTPVDK
ncbi:MULTISPECIES: hypothetical protein, partial [unclassified Caballeronia]|uniref:hypothetical protein n=1 Tax=unclassified Caballeronia TaxID=2646786 RepID=UPI002028E082